MRVDVITLMIWKGGGLCSYWNTIFLILQMMKNQGSIYISDWENVNRYSVTFFFFVYSCGLQEPKSSQVWVFDKSWAENWSTIIIFQISQQLQ